MNKLLQHFRRMQTAMQNYVVPDSYTNQFGEDAGTSSYAEGSPAKEGAFIGDMIWALDGPEQREAEAEASFDYVAEAEKTCSNTTHGFNQASAEVLLTDLRAFVAAAERLDLHKKVLFRSRSNADVGLPDFRPGSGASVAFYFIPDEIDLLHGIIGVATEAGELAEVAVKKLEYPGRADVTNVREEIGDVLWYLARLVKWSGTTFFAEMMRNIAKLRKRHGASFNAERDANRDLAAERVLLEGEKPYDPRDDEYGFKVADDPTFDEEQVAAAAEKALADAERVKTQAVDFPDEMTNGVDPMPGKHSDGN